MPYMIFAHEWIQITDARKYATGVAVSVPGLASPWIQQKEPLWDDD